MNVWTKKTSSRRWAVEIWKSQTTRFPDFHRPGCCSLFFVQKNHNRSETVTHVPGLLCYLCPSPLTNCLFRRQLCRRQLIGLAQFGKQPRPGGDHQQSSYSSEDYGWNGAEPLRG